MKVNFKLTEYQHNKLQIHLHPGDGLEAVAFGLCGRLNTDKTNVLLLHELYLLPYNECERAEDFVKWKIDSVEHLLEKALANDYAIIKFHSHGIKDSDFSKLDDISDKSFFECVYGWTDSELPHASMIMYPDGSFKGRIIDKAREFYPLYSTNIVGENISKTLYSESILAADFLEFTDRNTQAFGDKTTKILKSLKIGVVGCSGTGSPTIEQLVRLGVGELVLVDNDKGELANMNRIYGLKMDDVNTHELKVNAIKKHIDSIGLGTKVTTLPFLVQEKQLVVNELASCDLIFGCVDSAEGRHYLNLISHYYLIPLIDIGVKLCADGRGGIDSINGNIHYVYPGSASLLERNVYSSKRLADEEVKRTDPEEFKKRQVYFDNINVASPAVISINTLHSSLAVCEMLSRIHPYRYNENRKFDSTHINLCDWDISSISVSESKSRFFSDNTLGIGNKQPLIQIP
ncbi:ThiF family adenylyltransferase [Chryseobacterium sp. RG1]|uniref:ThiF family adenylyltransferase n=1 Tax=Chryseobacterium tagetis TaxID=2801334 RepID=A0ABS7ZZE7_9FLAO|nr:ThiF family adenylyltransferase [Chryseobacterium tagetis]MCA6067093.1 ThiF family adenylyltransferase [Chryseobacterium tagetis]